MLTGIGGKSYGFLIAKKYGITVDIVSDAISIYNQLQEQYNQEAKTKDMQMASLENKKNN